MPTPKLGGYAKFDNARMTDRTNRTPAPGALGDAEIDELQALLDAVPAPLEPLDATALDGFLCGVLLQPAAVAESHWLPLVTDLDARPLPAGHDATRLHALARARAAELARAIAARDWFDPWIYELDDDADASAAVLPWVAGFAAAQNAFPALMAIDDPALPEPLALLYRHFDADDLEDAAALQTLIDEIEPPADLAEAVQDLVRSVMLIADVTQPRMSPARKPSARAGRGRARRSRSGPRARAARPGMPRRCARRATRGRSSRL